MLRILLFTTWRVTLWGGVVGAALGALFGAGLLLSGALVTGQQSQWLNYLGGGLGYGFFFGLVVGLGLGVMNGVALGCALSVGTMRPHRGWTGVRRYTAMSIVFNALILILWMAVTPGSISARFVNTFSVAATGLFIILAMGGAAWVDTLIARMYLRSAHHRFTAL